MKIEWLQEARAEYQELLLFYRNTVGMESAKKFAKKSFLLLKACLSSRRLAF